MNEIFIDYDKIMGEIMNIFYCFNYNDKIMRHPLLNYWNINEECFFPFSPAYKAYQTDVEEKSRQRVDFIWIFYFKRKGSIPTGMRCETMWILHSILREEEIDILRRVESSGII